MDPFNINIFLKNVDNQNNQPTNQNQHKRKPEQFESVAGGVKVRRELKKRERKSIRLVAFDTIRDIPKAESNLPVIKQEDKAEQRRLQLEIWKMEKEKKKREAAALKKKPFIVGIAHGPIKVQSIPPLRAIPSTSGRVTRSQTVQSNKLQTKKLSQNASSFAPKNAGFNPNIDHLEASKFQLSIIDKTQKQLKLEPKQTEEKVQTQKLTIKAEKPNKLCRIKGISEPPLKTVKGKISQKPLSSNNVKNTIPKCESSSEEKLRSPKNDVVKTPENKIGEAIKISPYVTVSRGKENARKEMKKKIEEDDDYNDLGSVEHFKNQLNSEIKRITEMCNTWEKISMQGVLPDAVESAILGAVGQGRLLVSQKMQQFAGLVARCEQPDPRHPLVTAADLHGFWDMLFMQVENIDIRFKELEEMKARGWLAKEPQKVMLKKKVTTTVAADKPAATSRIRDMIAAARRAKKEQQVKQADGPERDADSGTKTFDAGFFCVLSPVRVAPAPATPRPQRVLNEEYFPSSDTKNSSRMSMAMMRASFISRGCKDDAIVADEPQEDLIQFTPVNLKATPGRSILKSGNTTKANRSLKCVLFDSSDNDLLQQSIDADISGVKVLANTSIDNEKENICTRKSKPRLERQNAVSSPVMTRSRRKSQQLVNEEDVFREMENTPSRTPRRSSRRK
ncbi:disks large-associated protein 5 isoform X2 [Leptidea sinapis]|uniref:disks large-associated protein 5 isoform X2 n=1 Tax=Leptidea sinapis TaxID=189913 RepID=UPI0021C3AD3D|nr:disks large-associated protein 5 isoform X2 [Leptidea sinapis]